MGLALSPFEIDTPTLGLISTLILGVVSELLRPIESTYGKYWKMGLDKALPIDV